MKKITAIVRPEKLEPLKEALFAAKVSGMTISQVQGCGSQHGWKEYYRGTEVLLNMVPKVKFEIICDDAQVDALIDVITNTARTGNVGDGKIFSSRSTRWCASAPASAETPRYNAATKYSQLERGLLSEREAGLLSLRGCLGFAASRSRIDVIIVYTS